MRDRRNGWGKTNKVGLGGVGEVHVLAGRGRKFSKMVGEEVGRCYYWKRYVQGDVDLLERYMFSVQFLVRIIRI